MEETRALLRAWSDEHIQKSLAENLRNRHVFKQLSTRMSEMGFFRNPQQCRLRVKTLKANYVRAKLQRSVGGSQPCTFKYFTEMDAVLSRRSGGGAGGSCTASPERATDLRSSEECPRPGFNRDATGHGFPSLERRGPGLSSVEQGERHCSWQLDSDIKLEGEEHSVDVFEFSSLGFPHQQRDVCQEDDQDSSTDGDLAGVVLNYVVLLSLRVYFSCDLVLMDQRCLLPVLICTALCPVLKVPGKPARALPPHVE